LTPGNYNVIVKNPAGCNSTAAPVTIDAAPGAPSVPVQTIDCAPGIGNATVTVTAPTGAGLEYSLDGGSFQAAVAFTGIANGSHTITVRNASGCITTGTSFSVSCGCVNGPALTLGTISGSTCGITPVTVTGNTFTNATLVNITDNGAGSVIPVTTSASAFDFTYTPSAADAGNTVIITITTDNPSGAPCAVAVATYTLTVNDVPAAPAIGIITQPATCDAASGRIELTNLPATGTWTINPGAITGTGTSTTLTGFTAGTYSFTVTSASGCTSAASPDIVINTVPGTPAVPEYAVTDPSCSSATGTIAVTSSTTGLTFSLDGAAFIAYPAGGFTLVAPGSHTLIAQNASNCLSPVATITVTDQPDIRNVYTIIPSEFNGFNISCQGQSNGAIDINTTVDPASLTFNWSGPAGFTSSAKDISGLVAGEYTVIISDQNNCSATEVLTLTEPPLMSMTVETSISADGAYQISCAGDNTGSISVLAVNGVGVIDYLWDDGTNGNVRTNLTAGLYTIIVRDANNCQISSDVVLQQPEPIKLAFDVTRPFCPDTPDGEIILTVTGGIEVTEYTYLWSDNSTARDLTNIPAGSYNVIVTDANSCAVQGSVDLHPQNETCLILNEAFSPNGDGKNDEWIIGNTALYPDMEITIYNRWGQSVWKSGIGYPVPWNGRSNGAELPIDSYHYIIDMHNGSKPVLGDVTIVR
jgi:gliding motility-associated-like protein